MKNQLTKREIHLISGLLESYEKSVKEQEEIVDKMNLELVKYERNLKFQIENLNTFKNIYNQLVENDSDLDFKLWLEGMK